MMLPMAYAIDASNTISASISLGGNAISVSTDKFFQISRSDIFYLLQQAEGASD